MSPAGDTVLVVEDNLETADVLRRILALRDFRVVAACDGIDAMALLHRGLRPAAIVLDLAMPNLDGRTFRSALLALPDLADIPVVVYSVDQGENPVPGVVGHVRKGVDTPDVLLGLVEAACARRRERGGRGGLLL